MWWKIQAWNLDFEIQKAPSFNAETPAGSRWHVARSQPASSVRLRNVGPIFHARRNVGHLRIIRKDSKHA